MIRYFLITFNLKNVASCGNILIEDKMFPSKTHITQVVQSLLPEYVAYNNVVVLNVFEFKTEGDYKNFQR